MVPVMYSPQTTQRSATFSGICDQVTGTRLEPEFTTNFSDPSASFRLWQRTVKLIANGQSSFPRHTLALESPALEKQPLLSRAHTREVPTPLPVYSSPEHHQAMAQKAVRSIFTAKRCVQYENITCKPHLPLDLNNPLHAYLNNTMTLYLEVLQRLQKHNEISSEQFENAWCEISDLAQMTLEEYCSPVVFGEEVLRKIRIDPSIHDMRCELLLSHVPEIETAPLILKGLTVFLDAREQNLKQGSGFQDIDIREFAVFFCADIVLLQQEKIDYNHFICIQSQAAQEWYQHVIYRCQLLPLEASTMELDRPFNPCLLRALNNLYWFENFFMKHSTHGAPAQAQTHPTQRSDFYARYVEQVLLPLNLQNCLYEEPGYNVQPHTQGTLPRIPATSTTLGEEVEFGKLERSGVVSFYSGDSVPGYITAWKVSLENIIDKNNITDYEITLESTEDSEYIIFCRTGTFHLEIYNDGRNVFEVNCSPYRVDQTFCINGKNFTTGELFDLLIFPTAHLLGHGIYSGHKHVDIRPLFNNEPESFIRLLADVQHQDHLPKAFGRDKACPAHFPYYKDQHDQYHATETFNYILWVLNHSIQSGLTPVQNAGFDNICALQNIMSKLNLLKRRGPLYIGNLNFRAKDLPVSDKVTNTPETTMEFRLFQAPPCGRGMDQMNTLILRWVDKARDDTRARKIIPLLTPSGSPGESCEIKNIKYRNFIEELGLDYPTYEKLAEQCLTKQIPPQKLPHLKIPSHKTPSIRVLRTPCLD